MDDISEINKPNGNKIAENAHMKNDLAKPLYGRVWALVCVCVVCEN